MNSKDDKDNPENLPSTFLRHENSLSKSTEELISRLRENIRHIQKGITYKLTVGELKSEAVLSHTLIEQLAEERLRMPFQDRTPFSRSLIRSLLLILEIFQSIAATHRDFPKDLVLDLKKFSIDILLDMNKPMGFDRLILDIKDYEWLWKEGYVHPTFFRKHTQERIFDDETLELHARDNIRSIVALLKNILLGGEESRKHPLESSDAKFFYENYQLLEKISVGE